MDESLQTVLPVIMLPHVVRRSKPEAKRTHNGWGLVGRESLAHRKMTLVHEVATLQAQVALVATMGLQALQGMKTLQTLVADVLKEDKKNIYQSLKQFYRF